MAMPECRALRECVVYVCTPCDNVLLSHRRVSPAFFLFAIRRLIPSPFRRRRRKISNVSINILTHRVYSFRFRLNFTFILIDGMA